MHSNSSLRPSVRLFSVSALILDERGVGSQLQLIAGGRPEVNTHTAAS